MENGVTKGKQGMEDKRGARNRILFAKRRLDELSQLGGGNFGTVSEIERQQPIQEFFFHLVGAIEFLAQTINDVRSLGIDEESVNPGKVCRYLKDGDPVKLILGKLYPQTRGKRLTQGPYSEEGTLFRIILFRNRVCHHGRNPFYFRVGSEPPCSLFLDPRDRQDKGSHKSAIEELASFWELVNKKCEQILSMD